MISNSFNLFWKFTEDRVLKMMFRKWMIIWYFYFQFDLWNDSQRKRFFDMVFSQCRRSQYKFIQDYFQEKVPLQHLDFTTVLPAFLSLYIFTFLEPKSLCRAAQACWHWKFLTEQVIYSLFLLLESIFNSEIFLTSLLILSI